MVSHVLDPRDLQEKAKKRDKMMTVTVAGVMTVCYGLAVGMVQLGFPQEIVGNSHLRRQAHDRHGLLYDGGGQLSACGNYFEHRDPPFPPGSRRQSVAPDWEYARSDRIVTIPEEWLRPDGTPDPEFIKRKMYPWKYLPKKKQEKEKEQGQEEGEAAAAAAAPVAAAGARAGVGGKGEAAGAAGLSQQEAPAAVARAGQQQAPAAVVAP
ncbi:unnamed protein product [Vitrella brassicaformis CCMP3155]|uniref:Uncharacterized protein n=1 Tax=Vitrella brassicaformis (strain CCMP3155) TaxID=1169540 RepID=A0A0G4EFT8_VITBC|nr:unnamed protein product [Vitrella brassicaformis CCMP3155]|eukprot:CEL94347.1 unnamed protein product [Vitrella brassicaformis CCMP3155]